eukprot:4870462-Amphidinium_carterae.1
MTSQQDKLRQGDGRLHYPAPQNHIDLCSKIRQAPKSDKPYLNCYLQYLGAGSIFGFDIGSEVVS